MGKGPEQPERKYKSTEREDAQPCKKNLFHGERLFLLLAGFEVMWLLPSTEGTVVCGSAPADAVIDPDDGTEQQNRDDDIYCRMQHDVLLLQTAS